MVGGQIFLSLVSFKLEMEAKIGEAISYRSSPGHLGLIDMEAVVGFTDGAHCGSGFYFHV